ncbi:hypothetical protein Taro_051867 [Colocasia esculenta]|uniref:Uncharacterized protein n=1 Tax=Colocasia esculenta TaxID=4460 RepID=A0A843XH55_COLES|nr:hypothetical protein [Colocasia esculenta]
MACSFWRWRQIWKAPFGRQKASSGSPECVDTTRECVDTLSHFCKNVLLGTETSVDTAWD